MKLIQTLLVVALAGLSFAASAQWQWLDKDGRKVFSDRAPPADIQDKNILKRPSGYKRPAAPVNEVVAEDANAAAAVAPAPSASQPALAASGAKPASGLDKELEAKKKLAKEADLAKRKAEEERVTKAKVENCARAKQAKTTFESGGRISRTNAAGEKEVMDEAAIAQELKRINGIVARDCQ